MELLKKTDDGVQQFIRYLLVAGFAAVMDTGCLYMLNSKLHINYLHAAAIAFVLGLTTNYLLSVAWVFETSGNFKQEFAIFAVIGVGGLLWTEAILYASVHLANIPVMPSKLIAMALVLIWNFGMRKKFVFRIRDQATD